MCQTTDDRPAAAGDARPVGGDHTEPDEDEYENDMVIRGKWVYDGAASIDEMIERLQQTIAYLRQLKADGWVVRERIDDDYAFLRPPPDGAPCDG